jgi:hypothetical protein
MVMKSIAAIACALTLGPAWAQCLPAEVNGSGTHAVLEFNGAGAAVAWWCPDRFRPRLTLYAVRWEALTPSLHAELTALWRAADKSAAIERMRAAHADTPLGSPALVEVWSPARARILGARPPTPAWVVASDGPMVQLLGGRLVDDPLRAAAGTVCDCSREDRRVIVDQRVYCRVFESRLAHCVPKVP